MDINIEKIRELAKDPQFRPYFIGGGIVFITFIYLVVLVFPLIGSLASYSSEISVVRKKTLAVQKKIILIDSMKKELDELTEELSKHSRSFSKHKEIANLLEGFATLANQSDVKILSITPSDLVKIKGGGKITEYYREMPIEITAKSGYHQLGSFISELAVGKQLIAIESVNIAGDGNDPRMHNVKIKLKTYVTIEDEKK